MPILIKPSSITKLFSFSKTMAAASAPPVPKLGAAEVKQVPAPKQRQAATRTHKNHKSIFSRIASPFKALSFKAIKERHQRKAETKTIRKEIENKNQSTAQLKTIHKEIENNMPDLKENMPLQLQNLVEKTGSQEISRSYINNFMSFMGAFTDQNGNMTPAQSILTSEEEKNPDKSAERVSEHLTQFCGGDKNQASTLSVLLTRDAVTAIHRQLIESSPKLGERFPGSTLEIERNVSMMKNNTARIVIKQDYISMDKSDGTRIIIAETTIDVPRQDPSSITLNSVDITPKSI